LAGLLSHNNNSIRYAANLQTAQTPDSVIAPLERAGIPTRFATDLELIFAGTLDLRSALNGGEHLRVLWRENHTGDRVIGEPIIDFIELDLGDDHYAVVWPDDDHRRTIIYRNGKIMRTFVQPIPGARLNSAFGPRVHPVHGYTRMHSGVDFGAPIGAVVEATMAGRIVFMATRNGYGLLVELEHAQGIRTRYAHLSALNETSERDRRLPLATRLAALARQARRQLHICITKFLSKVRPFRH
jgi:murein DD-endopeptidase MepM/ murein hydrolase activator NlpD